MGMREKLIELLRDVQYLGGLEEKIADHLIANGVIVLPVPVNTTIWEVRDYYDICDCCAKLEFNQVKYQPFKNGNHAVLLNTGEFSYGRTYFDTLEHAVQCLKQKVLTGEWDGPLVVGTVNGYYRHELQKEIQQLINNL